MTNPTTEIIIDKLQLGPAVEGRFGSYPVHQIGPNKNEVSTIATSLMANCCVIVYFLGIGCQFLGLGIGFLCCRGVGCRLSLCLCSICCISFCLGPGPPAVGPPPPPWGPGPPAERRTVRTTAAAAVGLEGVGGRGGGSNVIEDKLLKYTEKTKL